VYLTAVGKGDLARRIYILCALGNVLYLTCGVLLFALIFSNILQRGLVGRALTYIVGCCSLIIALSFFFLGVRLFLIFNRLQSGRRSEVVGKVVLISASCTICFLYKGIYVCLIPEFHSGDAYRLGAYLFLGEVIPSILMAGSFNYLPSRWQEAFANFTDLFHLPGRGSRGYGTLNRDQSGEAAGEGFQVTSKPASERVPNAPGGGMDYSDTTSLLTIQPDPPVTGWSSADVKGRGDRGDRGATEE